MHGADFLACLLGEEEAGHLRRLLHLSLLLASPTVRFRKTAPSSSICVPLASTSILVVVASLFLETSICMVIHLLTIRIEAPVSSMAVTIIVCCSPAAFGTSMTILSQASLQRVTSAN